ncbi:AraC family transcriptional regulator [Paenibacillus sp. PL2-23]|uniref:helix-turn-helix domain-containing protein n=1 Tax=Paenibacillus sp. PL2-23 TaxID=2100729 RepID=UPI0030F9AA4B
MKTMMELDKKWHQELPDALTLSELDTVEQLTENLSRVCAELCNSLTNEGTEAQLHIRMKQFLQEKYCDPLLTIDQLAERFDLSSSYASRYFKEQTGKTLWEYVNQLRIEQAMEMLRTTDLPLQDIVTRIGYNDVSSFIRKFKQQVQLTPGEYRKLHA